jgi:hypothetical protein
MMGSSSSFFKKIRSRGIYLVVKLCDEVAENEVLIPISWRKLVYSWTEDLKLTERIWYPYMIPE